MGAELQRAIEVMDRLRSPGGCPWDAEQTHASLARYLLEETYEVLEAIESGDETLLREELGDLLLQVLFHARIASERPASDGGFDIEDVARDLADKLVRRHPHVYGQAAEPGGGGDGETTGGDTQALNETWEKQKIVEKGRTSAVDGVPVAQPSLALAAKLLARAGRAGLTVPTPMPEPIATPAAADAEFGARLFELVREAVAAGFDPEGALRRTTMAYRAGIRAAEHGR